MKDGQKREKEREKERGLIWKDATRGKREQEHIHCSIFSQKSITLCANKIYLGWLAQIFTVCWREKCQNVLIKCHVVWFQIFIRLCKSGCSTIDEEAQGAVMSKLCSLSYWSRIQAIFQLHLTWTLKKDGVHDMATYYTIRFCWLWQGTRQKNLHKYFN